MVKLNTRFLFILLKSNEDYHLFIVLFVIFSSLASFALASGQSSPMLNGTVQSGNVTGASQSGNLTGASGNVTGASMAT